ncbi:MAG: NifU family protein [Malacoplasma sp.]
MLSSKKEKIINEINEVIDSLRYYIKQDGGDLEFCDYDDKTGEVVIRILGSCVGCSMIDMTYKNGVETILKSEIQDVKSIKLVE